MKTLLHKKNTLTTLLFIAFFGWMGMAWGQTNPTAQNLPYTQNFNSLTGTSPSYSAGWNGWDVSGSLSTSYVTSAPSADRSITVGNNNTQTRGVYDFTGKLGICSTGSAISTAILSVNTTNYSAISMSYKVGTQYSAGRINELGLQYRIGTTGLFTNISSSTYQNTGTNYSGTSNTASDIVTININLPSIVENNSVVQLRWMIRDVSGSGNRTNFSIDDISINGTNTVNAPILAISGTTTHGSTCVGTPATTQTYTITNTGSVAAATVSVSSNDSQFVVSNLSSTTIAASGGTATYDVTFTPTSSGAKTSTITVSSTTSGSNSPTSSLTGTGNATVSGAVTTNTASSITATGATLNGNVITLGTCPNTTEKGFVYALSSVNNDPTIANTSVAVSGLATGSYNTTLTGLTSETQYSYKAYMKDEAGNYTYGTAQSFTTLAIEPTYQPTNLTKTAVTDTTMTINWDAATSSPDGYIVVRRTSTAAPTTDPVDGTTYSVGTVLGNGTVVYAGSNLNLAMSSLTAATAYSFKVYSYNGSDSTINYLQTSPLTATGFYTLSAEPTNHSNSFTVNSVSLTSATLGFQAPNDVPTTRYLIIYKAGTTPPTTMPTDGALFGASSGDAIFATNTPTGTTTTFNVTGLTQGTTYTFLLIPFNRSGSDTACNYKTDGTIPSVTFTVPNQSSDVIPVASSESATISSLMNDAAPLSNTTGTKVWEFTIRDGASDTDNLPTKVSAITIAKAATSDINDFAGAIKTAALIDSNGNFVATASSITSTTLVFDNLNIVVPNQGSLTYTLRISLKETISNNPNIEGKDFGFSISNANITALSDATSSRFSSFTAAQSANNVNRVDIVASSLIFATQPQAITAVNVAMNTITIHAVDVNGNIDNDYVQTINLTSTGTLSATQSATAVAGVVSFSNVIHSASGIGFTLTASDGSLAKTSTSFDILGTPVATAATNVANTSFTANWIADAGASNGYALEVSTNPSFSTITNSSINEGFESGLTGSYTNGNLTLSTGVWSFVDAGLKVTGAGLYYSGSAASQMKANSGKITSPSFSNIISVTFYAKASSGTTTMKVSKNVNGTISVIETKTISNSYSQYTINVNEMSSNVKIIFEIGSTFGYIDDITINTSTTTSYLLPGYDPLAVSGQASVSASVIGLQPSTAYYYRLKAVNGANTSAYSNVITVYTGPIVWNGTAWSNVTGPDATRDAVINGNFTTNATDQLPFTAQSLVVNNGKTLTISPNHTITVQNAIENNGTIVVEDTGSLVQINETDTNSGSGTYNIYKSTRPYHEYDYNYWSSPIENAAFSTTFGTNSSLLTGSGNGASDLNYIYELNTAAFADDSPTDTWDDNYNDWVHPSGNMTRGKGYIVLGAGADFPFNASDFETGFKQQVRFDGNKVNNGAFTYTLFDDIDATTTASDNLIGNPYPSAIDAIAFYNANSNVITSTALFWTHDTQVALGGGPGWAYNFTNSDYALFNLDTGTGASANATPVNKYIASGQGFTVQLKDGSSSDVVSFTNAMRATDNTHFVRMANQEYNVLWLNMTDNTGLYRQIAVGFYPQGTEEIDVTDSPKMATYQEPEFYSLIPDNTNKLAIQGLADFNVDKQIPIGLTTTYQGNYQITLDHTEGIFTQGQAIYLEDKYLNVIHDFANGAYSFTQTAGNDINNRFVLRFTNATASTPAEVFNNMLVYPNPSKGVFNLAYYGSETLQYTLYDMTGKQIAKGVGNQIDLSNNAIGMYIAKITDGNAVRTVKLVRE